MGYHDGSQMGGSQVGSQMTYQDEYGNVYAVDQQGYPDHQMVASSVSSMPPQGYY